VVRWDCCFYDWRPRFPSFTNKLQHCEGAALASPNDPVHGPRRTYAEALVAPAESGFSVTLDGRVPRSPDGRPLVLPTAALAELVAGEWAAQGERILPASMPATRLAWTVIDRAPGVRQALADEVARFAGADLICYFAERPASLVRRQEERWGPVIQWAEAALGVTFRRAQGVAHQPQPPATLERCAALAAECDDFTLTGLAFGAALFGSAILAFAVQRDELTAEAAFALSRIDETFQEERWGVDAEAAAATDAVARDAVMLGRWFDALR
jgi:chaperone required for assembly of F1-ATPase